MDENFQVFKFDFRCILFYIFCKNNVFSSKFLPVGCVCSYQGLPSPFNME